ncbi:MAG: hypothetical protein EOP47_11050 [Sphingobacteriaceae bacterium]|nr:MAG: hypothetical protein EOP47_11050 [Sphingobacteriaceae bacterium]
MKLIKTLALILMSGMLFISCEKEYSEENGMGGGIAAGSLKAAGSGECLPSSVQGNYIAGTALAAANFINVTVDITAAGAYTIKSDTVNGYSFSATGIAVSSGEQTIKLTGSGTPTAAGLNTFTVKFGSSQCNIVVEAYPVGTGNALIAGVDCNGFLLGGTYTQNTAMTSANTVQVELNVTTAGLYNISTNAVNGVTFSASGFLATGTQMVTLTASGTPTASGVKTYTVTAGTSTCNFNVDFAVGTTTPPVGGNTWTFKVGSTTYSGTTNTSFIETTPVPVLEIIGVNAGGADFSLILTATSGSLGSGTYPGTVTGLGKFSLSFDFSEGSTEYTFMSMLGGNISTTITTYNTSTKVVEGTFSGTAKTGNDPTGGTVVNITGGKFKASLP